MAVPTARLVVALRETAARLASPAAVYRWSHFGHCNCGHLAQTITGLPARTIYQAAFRRPGDWGQQAAALDVPDFGDRPANDEGAWEPEGTDHCAATGSPLEVVLGAMYDVGLERRDIEHLEDLSDERVLRRLGAVATGLPRDDRASVVRYLEAWADLVESQLPVPMRPRLVSLDEEIPIAAEE